MKKFKILGIDYETQGFPAEKTNATEVGAILMEVTVHEDKDGEAVNMMPTRKEIGRLSTLIWEESYPAQSPLIVELTGITDAMLKDPQKSVTPHQAIDLLVPLLDQADILMAHNVPFDRAVFEEQWRRRFFNVEAADQGKETKPAPAKEWICSLHEVPYPPRFTCKKLGHLALDHGVKMDHRNLHRATDDVELMFDLVLGNYHLLDVLAYKNEPRVTLKIDIPPPWKDGGVGKACAEKNGYKWNKPKDAWVKTAMKKNYQIEQDNGRPFRVSVLA